jgi:hypothetical protein
LQAGDRAVIGGPGGWFGRVRAYSSAGLTGGAGDAWDFVQFRDATRHALNEKHLERLVSDTLIRGQGDRVNLPDWGLR